MTHQNQRHSKQCLATHQHAHNATQPEVLAPIATYFLATHFVAQPIPPPVALPLRTEEAARPSTDTTVWTMFAWAICALK